MAHFLVIHGLENHRPVGHWHRILTGSLRATGHVVAYPQLPNPDAPVLNEWLEVISAELELLKEADATEVVVIAHSLGCVTWLRYIERLKSPIKISRVLLVAPADPELLSKAPTFVEGLTIAGVREKLHRQNPTIIASDNDPWLPRGVEATFSDALEVQPTIWPGAAHFSLGDGWGEWSGVYEWALDPKADLLQR
jgi:predicted alpha/beta hydrolase family esterase